MRARAGFTLFELLVVLTILGLIAALATPMIGRGFPGLELRSAAREVAAGLRATRGMAIAENRPQAFTIDVEARTYRIGEEEALRALPPDIALTLVTAESEVASEARGAIRFFPDGTATGGQVTLRLADNAQVVTVEWLTGHVSIGE